MTNTIQQPMISEESHRSAYPITHAVWDQVKNYQWPDRTSLRAAQFMFDSIGIYEHGEADLPKGTSLKKYSEVILDQIVGWFHTVTDEDPDREELVWDAFRTEQEKVHNMGPVQVWLAIETEHDETFSDNWSLDELETITKYLSWVAEAPEDETFKSILDNHYAVVDKLMAERNPL